jgi:hypothetical protein
VTAGSAGTSSTTGAGGSSGGAGGSSGGAGGRAGSGGSGGATLGNDAGPPHVLTPCPSGNVGKWEDVTPAAIRGKQYAGGAILVDPHNPATVYLGAGSEGLGLFKSTDCGANWVHINTGMNGSELERGRLWDMVIDPVNPEVLYSVSGYGSLGLWKTTNGGVDWVQLFPPTSEVAKTASANFASIVSMDPHDHLHLVVAFHNGCSGAYSPSCQAETKDGGTTWRLFKVPGGGEGSGPVVINATSWVFGVYEGLYYTGDSGATWKIAIKQQSCHYQMHTDKNGKYYIGCQGGVITSSGDGSTWSLIPNSGYQLQGLTGDGKGIFAGQQFGQPGKNFTASEDSPTIWKEMPNTGGGWGPYFMAGDPDHHIIYGSEMGDGVWRLVTY